MKTRSWTLAFVAAAALVTLYLVTVRRDERSPSNDATAAGGLGGDGNDSRSAAASSAARRGSPARSADLGEAVRLREAAREQLRQGTVPDSVAIDDQYPAAKFYDQFKSSVEQNAQLRKLLRRCMLLVPEGTTEVAYRAVLTLVRDESTHKLRDVVMVYEGVDIDKYMDCARDAYLTAAPALSLPGVPDVLRVRTSGRFSPGPTTAEGVRELLDRMHNQLSRTTDSDLRAVLEESIAVYECIDQRGLEHRRECFMQ